MATAKGDATRARILESTVDLLIRVGPERTFLDDILAATSTSKSQLFHYFPGGKDELVHAATAAQVSRLLGRETISRPLDTWEAWDEWMATMIRLHRLQSRDDACEVSALAGRSVDPDPESRRLVGDAYETWLAQVESGIQSMRETGLLRAGADPHRLAITILASLQGGAVLDRATGSSENLEIALESAVAQLRGFVASP